MNQPRIPPMLEVMMMARGDAMFALEHSSLRWKGASYPLMVQITPKKDIRTARPSGHSVLFVNIPQTWLALLVLGELILAAGATMRKTTIEVMLMTVPT